MAKVKTVKVLDQGREYVEIALSLSAIEAMYVRNDSIYIRGISGELYTLVMDPANKKQLKQHGFL